MTRRRLVVGLSAAMLLVACGAVLWGLNRSATEVAAAGEEDTWSPMDWWDWSKAEAMITVEAQEDLPELHRAAGTGDLAEVKRLLVSGGDVNGRDADGWTPLHWAAYEGQTEVVKFLLENGAERGAQAVEPGELNWLLNTDFIRPVPPEQWTSLHKRHNATPLKAALAKGRREAGELLLDRAHDEGKPNELLFWAVKWGYGGGAAIMLGHGADANAKDEEGWSALHWAARGRSAPSVAALLKAGADPNARAPSRRFLGHHMSYRTPEGQTPLHLGAHEPEVVRLLVAAGADVQARDANGSTPLHSVGDCGEAAEALLEAEADVNARDNDGETPLAKAMGFYNTGARDAILAHGADVNAKDNEGKSLLHKALGYGSTKLAAWLLDHGADPNGKDNGGRTPLHDVAAEARWTNGVEYAELLLDRGADAGAREASGATPLDLAIREGNREVALFLWEPTAASRGDNGGGGPLQRAAAAGDVGQVEELLGEGRDVNTADGMGLTPLHMTVTGGHREVLELLLDKGADVNAGDRFGWTPLHKAAWDGELIIGEILLEKGAKVDARTKAGDMPLHLAVQRGKVDMSAMLLSNGADVSAQGRDEMTPMDLALDIVEDEFGETMDRMYELLEEFGAEW